MAIYIGQTVYLFCSTKMVQGGVLINKRWRGKPASQTLTAGNVTKY